MKFTFIDFLLIVFPIAMAAQVDTALSKKEEKIYTSIPDSSNNKLPIRPQLPPGSLIIKMKDLSELKNIDRKYFIIIDDTSNYSSEELTSGLSKEELASYKRNKNKIKETLTLPPAEEVTYPIISTVRKILGVAKVIAVIIILIMSL